MGICWLPLTQKEYPALLRDYKAQHWNKIWRVSFKVPEKSISLGELWHCGGPVVFLLENCNTPQELTPDIPKFKYTFWIPFINNWREGSRVCSRDMLEFF